MPFCVNCGAQNRDGARFCEACGKPVTQLAGGTPPPPAPTPGAFQPVATPTEASGSAKMLLLAGMGVYAVGAILTLMGGDFFAFVTCLLLVAGIYAAAYAPAAKGQAKTAKNGALAAAAVALIFGFLDIAMGGVAAAMFNFVAAALVGLAWNGIKA